MGMVSLLFSFRGRIGRKQYWFGMGLVGFLSFVGQMLASVAPASSLFEMKGGDRIHDAGSAGAAGLPVYLIVAWCTLAIQFKRFHDRGRTGWISVAPLALVLMLLASVLGDVLGNAPLERTVGDLLPYAALLMLTSLGFFIDLGCMGSVEGVNKYGP
ncbi:MAG: DUF805 domain-containing protein, partial [Proteobacteria bacterium]|nr:DUF805 domain-containing protein [Pseudomonadota bacterium]